MSNIINTLEYKFINYHSFCNFILKVSLFCLPFFQKNPFARYRKLLFFLLSFFPQVIAGGFISTGLIPLEFFQAFISKAAEGTEWIKQVF